MTSKTNNGIFGLRKPTDQEHAWIVQHWANTLRFRLRVKEGKGVRYVGVFLTATAAAMITQGTMQGVGACIALMFFASFCFVISSGAKMKYKKRSIQLRNIENGEYLVASARSTNVRYERSGRFYMGKIEVEMQNGQRINHEIKAPYETVEPFLRQANLKWPVLLIQLEDDDEILGVFMPR